MSDEKCVAMIHHQCDVCAVTATMVVTEASERAWRDHLDIHGPDATSHEWTWEVIPLKFDEPITDDYLRSIRLSKGY